MRSIEMQSQGVTQHLEAWNAGDPEAPGRVLPLLYDELRAIARSYLRRERRGHTLEATAVVHEAYLRLVEDSGIAWHDRAHFVGLTARVMRRVLVDYARQHRAAKRGGDGWRVTLAEADVLALGRPPDLVAVDEALRALEEIDPRKAAIVELRFFGGLTFDEIAAHLGVARSTVVRHWERARLWLYRQLSEEAPAAARG